MTTITTPQAVGGAVRRLMRDASWSWRHMDYPATGSADSRATAILQRDYTRAYSWLRRVSDMTTLPLPQGNGSGGPWHRVAYVTPDGCYAVVDIAHGRAVAYDARVPAYVLRFAATQQRAVSVSAAGGSGAAPAGWRQIAVVIMGSHYHVRVTAPRAVAARYVITGLATCYGSIGDEDAWRDEYAPLSDVPRAETTEPQRERLYADMQRSLASAYIASTRLRCLTLTDGYSAHGGERLCDLYVTGTRPEREEARRTVDEALPRYIMERARLAAAEAAEAVLARNGMRTTTCRGAQTWSPTLGQPISVADVLARLGA